MENITLTLTVNQVNVIMTALGKAPYEAVVDVIQAIRDQALPQVNKAEVD
jgi:DNA-binding protein